MFKLKFESNRDLEIKSQIELWVWMNVTDKYLS